MLYRPSSALRKRTQIFRNSRNSRDPNARRESHGQEHCISPEHLLKGPEACTTIHEQRLTCNECGCLASKERYRCSDLTRLRKPSHRNPRHISGLAFTTWRIIHPKQLRFGRPWRNRICGNTVRRELDCHRSRDTFERSFRCRVTGTKSMPASHKAGDVDNAAESCGSHSWQ